MSKVAWTVDEVRQPDGETDLDHLLLRGVLGQVAVDAVVDNVHARRALRVSHDRRLVRCVQTVWQWVVTRVRQLVRRQPRCSTEQYVRRDSRVALVGDRGCEVRHLTLRRGHCVLAVDDGAELHQRL